MMSSKDLPQYVKENTGVVERYLAEEEGEEKLGNIGRILGHMVDELMGVLENVFYSQFLQSRSFSRYQSRVQD